MADTGNQEHYSVGEDAGASFYTRYPNGIGPGAEAFDLCCPKCGWDKVKIIGEWYPARHMHLGNRMRCAACLHEFTVTENCWKLRILHG